jgi:acyl-[acyl-carrier-protein]-phospholipid O-acyltransferase / long-chain-fatty-acid--[acyl-carrier-protein] ligase
MNLSVNATRFRLAALWVAVFARAVGANAVITFAILHYTNVLAAPSFGLFFLVLGLSAVPAFALAPLIGAIASSKTRWPMMVATTLGGLAVIAWTSFDEYRTGQGFWYGCIAVLALEAAFFSACRFALIPEAARAARVSLPQLNGVFLVALAGGMLLGLWIGIEQYPQGKEPGLPIPLQFAHIGYGLALVCILLARLPVAQPVRINDGLVVPFAKHARAIWRLRNGRNALLALLGLFTIALVVYEWLMPKEARYAFWIAMIVGIVIGSLHFHPFRTLGIVPYASISLAVCAIWAVAADNWINPAIGMACCIGMMAAPLLTAYQINQPDDKRGHGGALLHCGWALITGFFLSFLLFFATNPPASRPYVSYAVLGLSLAGLVFAWTAFLRPAVELLAEIILWPIHRISVTGPGAPLLPWKGPVLVIANHAAWFDPLWVGKILPAPFTPMMTSRFFDLPFIGWLFRRVICAIRVPDVVMRKEAPEIKDAIAALNRGDCVIIFPEGWLRRREEQVMRRFGRGIWQILKERPDTPIFACWIEGNWGSFVSWKGGPPLKGKKIDFWRKIRITILEPFKVDRKVLDSHMETRTFLMKAVLQARALQGLPPFDPFRMPAKDEENGNPVEGET